MINIYELWLISVNISNSAKRLLLKHYGSEKDIYLNLNKLHINSILKEKEISRLKEINLESGKKLYEKLVEHEIDYVTIGHKGYPEELRYIYEPPYVLFYKGNLSLVNEKLVAVVGSRRCSNYGKTVTKAIVHELSKMNYIVVSGVADGIDSIAHREALENKVPTIGVLGCGIDVIYPASNRLLYKEIGESGLLISEFEPGTRPMAYNFPRRNRIISGLCKGVIVTEASVKSGSIITANYALEQGKDIMAVPGPVVNDNSRGCNKLLGDGAKVFTEVDDLYIFLNEIKEIKKNNTLDTTEKYILSLITSEPIHLDKIIRSVNIDRSALFAVLFEMQNRNEIICLPGNYYAKLN